MRPLCALFLTLWACNDEQKPPGDSAPPEQPAVDEDQDGWPVEEDCQDDDPLIHPDAQEICDGADNDCDGLTDEDVQSSFFPDLDGDSYGDEAGEVLACEAPDANYVARGEDCDDTDAAIHPGADEDDCTDPTDYDCDGVTEYEDLDGDGWAACVDCDDGDEQVHPKADEYCNGIDDDCDGEVDEAEALEAASWHPDEDGDGYGGAAGGTASCSQPTDWVADGSDCDDGDAAVHPEADEYCNGYDDDCDKEVDEDEAVDAASWHPDLDGDNYGDDDAAEAHCDQPKGYLAQGGDCDDGDAGVNPGASEICNEADDDCDGDTDEDGALGSTTFYADADGDGFGDPDDSVAACDQPTAYVSDDTDCDDSDATINPDGEEVCNDLDDDCDDERDDGVCDGDEDCTDGVDNEGDGLADCEDADCVDVCMEDCSDGSDNDADGLVDCDDDECYGESGCEGPYVITLETEIPALGWVWGGYIPKIYSGDYAASVFYAEVELEGTAYGWSGTDFTCYGAVRAYSFYSGYGFYFGGIPKSGPDYYFTWEPVEGGGLTWDGGCPLTGLPYALLGFYRYQTAISRQDEDGSWYVQYSASSYYHYDNMPNWYLQWEYDMVQTAPVTWTGYYY